MRLCLLAGLCFFAFCSSVLARGGVLDDSWFSLSPEPSAGTNWYAPEGRIAYWDASNTNSQKTINYITPGTNDLNFYLDILSGPFPTNVGYNANGRLEQAFYCDGVANCFWNITDPPETAALFPDTVTVSVWIQPFADMIGKNREISYFSDYYGWTLRHDTVGKIGWYVREVAGAGGNTYVQSTTIPPTNAWTLVTATYDGTNSKLYINGALEGTTPTTNLIYSSLTDFVVCGGVGTFHSYINDFMMWGRALNSNEVAEIYDYNCPVTNQSTGLGNIMVR